jgi:hypothetical protein
LDKFRRFLDEKLGKFGGKCIFYNAVFFEKKIAILFIHITKLKRKHYLDVGSLFFICNFVMHPKENLAKFGYKPNIKVFLKTMDLSIYILGYLLELLIKIWRNEIWEKHFSTSGECGPIFS